MTTNPRQERESFRQRLLPGTVSHAAKSVPAYRELYGSQASKVQSIADLKLLPIVTKEHMMGQETRFRDNELATVAVQHTGGTTNKPLLMHRSQEEFDFIREFFTAVATQEAEEFTSTRQEKIRYPLCVSLFGNMHGDPTPVPFPGRVFTLDVNDSYWNVQQLMSDPAEVLGGHVDSILLSGLESQLRILTCRLLELGFDFKRSCVTAIFSTGDFITQRLKNWYESVWGAPLSSRYSMSEMFGGARECERCGFWHFEPHVIGEAVDPIRRTPVETGYAVLVATCLYPFVRKQPLIRYWTGDLVELGPTDCRTDRLGFKFAGRLAGCVMDDAEGRAAPLLASALVYDVLDDFPDVASSAMFPGQHGVSDRSALGHLKFAVSTEPIEGGLHLKLRIETRYCAYMYPQHSERICSVIRESIADRHPQLKRRIAEGKVQFSVVPALPGSLGSFMVDEKE